MEIDISEVIPPEMNVLYMKYAVEVARTGSVNKADENLYVAQPNLSRALKELETSLGTKLFKRTSGGMTLTRDGEEFIRHAEHIIAEVEELEGLFRDDPGKKISFSLCAPHCFRISAAFCRFAGLLPSGERSEITYAESDAAAAINGVVRGGYRLGIVRCDGSYAGALSGLLDEKGLYSERLGSSVFEIVTAKTGPLSGHRVLWDEDLAPFTEACCRDGFVPYPSPSELKKNEPRTVSGRCVYVTGRAAQTDLLTHDPETYMKAAYFPRELAEQLGLCVIPYGPKETFCDTLICRNGYAFTDYDKLFISCLHETLHKI